MPGVGKFLNDAGVPLVASLGENDLVLVQRAADTQAISAIKNRDLRSGLLATADAVNLVATGGGGTGTLGLAAGSGFPGAEALGLSPSGDGSFWIGYRIGDRAGPLSEVGRGKFNPSTMQLARPFILSTGGGAGTLVNRTASAAPAAINVPAGAPVQFFLGTDLTAAWTSGPDTVGMLNPLISGGNLNTIVLPVNTLVFVAAWWPGGNIASIAFNVGTPQNGATCAWGICDSTTANKPGSSIISGGTAMDAGATNAKVLTVNKTRGPELIWPWLYTTTAGIALYTLGPIRSGPQGSFSWTPLTYYTGPSGTAISEPATGAVTGFNAAPPMVWLKQY